jgi:hypothetical protein
MLGDYTHGSRGLSYSSVLESGIKLDSVVNRYTIGHM